MNITSHIFLNMFENKHDSSVVMKTLMPDLGMDVRFGPKVVETGKKWDFSRLDFSREANCTEI